MELVDCVDVIAKLQGNYPNATFTSYSPQAFYETLREYSRDEVMRILPSVMKERLEYSPTAPRIAKAIDDARTPPLNAQEAWGNVHAAIRSCGCTQARCLRAAISDDRIWNAAETIGWQRLGLTPFEQHGTLFAQFKSVLSDTITTAKLEEQRVMLGTTGTALLGDPYE